MPRYAYAVPFDLVRDVKRLQRAVKQIQIQMNQNTTTTTATAGPVTLISSEAVGGVQGAILSDGILTETQKATLLEVYYAFTQGASVTDGGGVI